MKIRNGFVSNSSSSSFVVINPITSGDYIQKLRNKFKGTVLVVDKDFGDCEFGWDVIQYKDFGSKIIFSYLQSISILENKYGEELEEKAQGWLNMLESVIMNKLEVTGIEWKITSRYGDESNDKVHGYIDHQSSSWEGENTEIFDNKDILANFLFNPTSYIETGNDNE
jgi:hypothetical protein